MAAGQFRSDLYYRLNVYTIRLPPLRERTDDLPLLVEHFLRRFGKELGKEVRGIAPEATDLIRRYPWPGNLRELQSAVKQALLQTTGPVLLPEFLPPAVRGEVKAAGDPAAPPALGLGDLDAFVEQRLRAGSHDLYAEWQVLTERHLLSRVLKHAGNNLSQAARILGINRATLRSKLSACGLLPDRPGPGEDPPASP
jgi:two-component system nitrogen regulation response regulator GlnG